MAGRWMLLCAAVVGCGSPSAPTPAGTSPAARQAAPPPEVKPLSSPVVFTPPPADPGRAPRLVPVRLPPVRGGAAVWGAIGRDHAGRVFVGVSCEGVDQPSAHLIEVDPDTGRATDRGGAVEHLTRLGRAKAGHGQNKIHMKIVPAADGRVYFASMDEGGENEDGSKLPTFGSHLWRLTPGRDDWEHVGEVREAVIAAASGGRFVYFLAYFGHVLYQFDTEAGRVTNRVAVGSAGGHTTRNFVADDRGHVYVPRVAAGDVRLVEFDVQLREVAAFPLADYGTTPDSTSHGQVGVTPLAAGAFAFVTDRGRLYRLDPRATGSRVTDLGFLHPGGPCYCATLFSYDGTTGVVGLAQRPGAESKYDWVAFDLRLRTSTAVPAEVPVPAAAYNSLLVYGSATRDDAGRLYVGGRYVVGDTSVPMVWQVVP